MLDAKSLEIMAKREALKGVRVLDITRIIYGPWAANLLAVMGAEVIHVEIPGPGDLLIRAVSPGGVFPRGMSPGMMCCNSNKYYLAVDMHKEEGLRIIKELAAQSDIIMENFKPGTFDRWGIGYRQLKEINPDIIYVSMQGFGNWGPYWTRPSYDAYAQGITGLAEITGFPDGLAVKAQTWIGDFLSGTLAAFFTLAALRHRNRTGEGQFIDLSQAEVLMRAMDWTWLYQSITGEGRKRTGNWDPAVVPSLIARTRDGFVAIGAFPEEEFQGLCRAMGREELFQEFRDVEKRQKEYERVYRPIDEWAAGKTTQEILDLSREYGFAAAPVNNSETIHKSPHFNARKMVWKFLDPLWGDLAYPRPWHLSETPGRVRWSIRPVGFDNEHVMIRILGYTEGEVEELYEKGVLGKWDKNFPATAPPQDWDGRKGLFY